MRIRRPGPWLALLFAVCFSNVALAQTAAAPNKDDLRKQVVQRGHDAYYSLRSLGLVEFQSTIKPNWAQVLKDQNASDPAQAQAALNLLNGLHFTMVLDKNGNVTVKHRTDTEPANEQVRQGFEDIYSGINQAVSGFFATWSLFMLNTPFPEVDGAYQLDDLGSQYRLAYKEGSSDIVTLMNKDLAITEIQVTSPQFISIVKPRMNKTAKGFVLTGYVGDYTPKSGPGVVHLDVKIDHAPVNGLQLPVSLIADTTLDGAPTHMELAFSEHQVKSR
jgi:hypothetical protein